MKQGFLLASLAAGNIGVAFFLQWYVLAQLGPGIGTDALFAGMTLPQLVLSVVSGSLMQVLVPLLAGESEERLHKDAWGFFLIIGGAFALMALLLFTTASWWVPFTVPGFSDAAMDLTMEMARIQLIGMVFAALSAVQGAVYHAKRQFIRAEILPLLLGAGSMALLIWALPKWGVVTAAWISALRFGLQALLMMPSLGKVQRPDIKSLAIQAAWQRIKPLLLGTAYYKTDTLVDRVLLSMAGAGSLSLFYLGQQIYGALNGVLNKAVCAPLVPKLSALHKLGAQTQFELLYRARAIQILTFTSVCLVLFAVFGKDGLEVVVGWGAFGEEDIDMLWLIMAALGGVLIGGSIGQITSTAFYARGDTHTPTVLSMITYTVFVPIKVAAFLQWGAISVAIVTSIYYVTNVLLQWVFLRVRTRHGHS